MLYADGVATGWADCSWDADIDYSNPSPVYQGSASISYTATAAWGGLQICRSKPIPSGYTTLTFAARASTTGQAYGVWLADANGNQEGRAVSLANYGGQPGPDGWTVYSIPLVDFNVGTKGVYGVTIEESLGQAQLALYIDALGFK